MHEDGYTYFEISQVTLPERRRLLEGKRLLSELREQQREQAASDDRPEQHQRKEQRKQRAAEKFAESRGLA